MVEVKESSFFMVYLCRFMATYFSSNFPIIYIFKVSIQLIMC